MKHRNLPSLASQATLRTGGAAAIPALLRKSGIDPAEILADAGIDPALFDDPDNLMTYAARGRLIKLSTARTGCEHFGLLVGQRMSLNSLGLVGLLMRSMPDARGALRALVNSLQIHSQGAVTTLEDDGRVAVLSYNAIDPTIEATDQTGDGAVAMMLNVMRELCGPDFQAIEASFAHRQPANIKPFQRFFRVPLYFNAAHFALAFSSDWLDVPVPYADADLQRLLEKQIDVIKSRRGMQFPDQVRDVLRSALLTNCCSEEKIAALFGIPARTFMRRLKSCETGFQELVDQTRFEMAQLMLTNTSLTIGQIGDLLGYARASTFIRAFRRWSNTTPAAWRKTNLEFSVGDKDSVNG